MAVRQKEWRNFARLWDNFEPPTRPSRYDIAVFRKYLDQKIKQKGKNTKVLILGSTPELRSIVSQRKITAYVVDYHKENYRSLTRLKEHKGKEILIQQDWRDLKLKDKFDLVFAEASLNMLRKDEVGKVIKKVNDALEKDGLFVNKTWILLEKKLTMEGIMKLYRSKYNHKRFKFALPLHYYSIACRNRKQAAPVKEEYRRMKRLYEKGILTKREFESFCNLGYEDSELEVHLPKKKGFEKTARKYMKIKRVIYPKPIGPNKIPVYVLVKKSS